MKSVFPKDELVGEGVMWNDVQNGLSLGYRITGNEWRILGKEVKVELWVRNPGDKDVKFQLNMRPDIGLRMKLKDETGVKGAKELEHESSIVPIDVPPLAEHRLLPPGHALKVKEAIIVSLLWPENDVSGIGGHFFTINPGAYDFQCELELPGFTATGEGGKQFTPAEGEWTGKLTTRSLNVTVITPDAPAPKPPIEQVEVGIIPEHLRDSTLLVATAAGQESVPGVGEIVLHAIDIDTNKPIPNVTFVQENLLAEQWAISVGTSNHDGTLTFRSKPLPGYFFSVLPVPEGFKVAGLDEVPAGIRVGERIEHRFYLRKLGTNLQFLDELTEPPLTEQSLLIPSEFNGQDSIKLSVHDMPGFTGQEIKFAFQRSNDKLAERVFRNGKRVRAALADEIKYFRKAEGVKAGDISEVSEVIIGNRSHPGDTEKQAVFCMSLRVRADSGIARTLRTTNPFSKTTDFSREN